MTIDIGDLASLCQVGTLSALKVDEVSEAEGIWESLCAARRHACLRTS
jgi:hypothetical protein